MDFSWKEKIFGVDKSNFEQLALTVFQYQFEEIELYKKFCMQLSKTPETVCQLTDIPFLPIQFFKNAKIASPTLPVEITFKSSTTGGGNPSSHFVNDISFYETSFLTCFEKFYGNLEDYIIFGLLPSYLERGDSSLVYMVKNWIEKNQNGGGFFMHDFEKLKTEILQNRNGKKILLIGVTYALLDFSFFVKDLDLPAMIVMETGGMKGKRKEMTKAEVQEIFKLNFKISEIHSEYGMTELLSQAYSKKDGIFYTPLWMRVLARSLDDPFDYSKNIGGLNVIDLANLHSCSFIETSDMGKCFEDGSFEVLGRLENVEMRGCNLMYNE